MPDTDFKETVRDRVDFPELVAQTVPLKRYPNGHGPVMAFCPFHPDHQTPSLAVYEDHAYCFGACRQHWDLYGWIMQRERVEFKEALEIAAGMAGLSLPNWTPERQAQEQKRRQQRDPPFHDWCRTVWALYMEAYDLGLTAEMRDAARAELKAREAAKARAAEVAQKLANLGKIPHAKILKDDSDQVKELRWELKIQQARIREPIWPSHARSRRSYKEPFVG